jgi:hypothetical protein
MFRVEWTDAAYDDLASAWTSGDSGRRRAINRAVQTLEARLQADPLAVGESRDGDYRVVHERPIGMDVLVDLATRAVTVVRVWDYE